ncbi:MAG: single-stranded DNA-binding protein [Calditrichaeota bacterium]|nr:single-stranded DNA-binding protein [Calditrichota bacterium]MCB9391372.1 single-stranded DNA-binding protein [Calditrichota bacterium]
MVNRVTLIGRLGRDPEMRYTPSGTAVARFSLATDENRKDQSGNWQTETTWHNIVVFGQSAERVSEQFKKGFLAYVEGKISIRNWEDKEGQKRTSYEILANFVRNLTPRSGGSESFGESGSSSSEPTHSGGSMEEDLPF